MRAARPRDSQQIQEALGNEPGDPVRVELVRDEAHRKVEVPPNLAGALTSARVKAAFEASFSSEQRQAVGALEA